MWLKVKQHQLVQEQIEPIYSSQRQERSLGYRHQYACFKEEMVRVP